MQTQKFGVDAFDALFSKSADFRSYVTNIETAVKDKYNTSIWRQWYPKADSYSDGEAVKVIEVVKTASVLLDARSRYGEFTQSDHAGAEFYNSGLANFGKGFFYTMQDREKMNKLGDLMDQNATLIDQYTDKAMNLIEGAYGTLDVMSLQLTGTGTIDYTYGMGLRFKQTVPIPAANFQKAGDTVWTDKTAMILTRMQEAEKYMRETLLYTAPLKWRVGRALLNNILTNTEVINSVGLFLNNKGVIVKESWGISLEQYNDWINGGSNNGKVSRIELVPDTYGLEQTNESGRNIITPWNASVAVLSPDMPDGRTVYSAPTEFTGIAGNGHNISLMEGGLLAFDNYVTSTRYPEWHTDMIMGAAPTMERWRYHMLIDSSTIND